MSIVTYPNRDLRNRVSDADPYDANLYSDLRRMNAVMEFMKGVGIAAPQIGIDKRLAIVAAPNSSVVVLLNPEILWSSPEVVEGIEGCLSVPDLQAKITRPHSVKVKYTNLSGFETVRIFEGFEARVVQHEIDHLDGVLIIDKLPKVKQMIYKHRKVR